VPASLQRELAPVIGDVSAVPIHRGGDSDTTAKQLSAKAFTVGGEVHLPQKLGSTESGEGREVLAHELTHVQQQRQMGSSLPHEDSPVGQQLEQQAREVAGTIGKPQRAPDQPLAHLSVPAPRSTPSAPAASAHTMPYPQQVAIAEQVQRAALESGFATATPIGVSFTPPASVSPPAVQRAAESSSPAPSPPSTGGSGGAMDVEGMKPEDIEKLLDKLFPRLRLRLRGELLVQRERAGLLHDTRSFGAR
jgi:hypothetical protein